MEKHIHDFNKDLRENGWWERETPEVFQSSIMMIHSSDIAPSSYIGVTENLK